jgi:hypothetical protein
MQMAKQSTPEADGKHSFAVTQFYMIHDHALTISYEK